jgi:hypothetical protein
MTTTTAPTDTAISCPPWCREHREDYPDGVWHVHTVRDDDLGLVEVEVCSSDSRPPEAFVALMPEPLDHLSAEQLRSLAATFLQAAELIDEAQAPASTASSGSAWDTSPR